MWTLYALPYSPWSEKARWALDHAHVAYREVQHVPLLGEPLLRWRAGRQGRPTVPLLVAPGGPVSDSAEIARRADTEAGAGLFADPAATARWNEAAEDALAAGRALVLRAIEADRAALRESIPAFFPRALHPALLPTARAGVRFLARKYDAAGRSPEADLAVVRTFCASLRAALAGRPHLVGDALSFADIAAAAALQFVAPVADEWLPLGPATRRAFTRESIARDFPDLLAWRDDLYQRCRRASPETR
jgi:glutathione S-transferase